MSGGTRRGLGLLLLRSVVGAVFVGHGAQKLFGAFGGPGLRATGQAFDGMGLRPGRVTAPLAGAAELGGGALLASGFLTPLGAAATGGSMSGAIAAVHAPKGPWNEQGGYEYNVLLMAVGTALALMGPGRFSLDRLLGTERRGAGWAAAALAAAVGGGVGAVRLGRRMPAEGDQGPSREDEDEAGPEGSGR